MLDYYTDFFYIFFFFFFFNDTATTEIYTLSLHDALPIFFAISLLGNCDSIRDHSNVIAPEPLFQEPFANSVAIGDNAVGKPACRCLGYAPDFVAVGGETQFTDRSNGGRPRCRHGRPECKK